MLGRDQDQRSQFWSQHTDDIKAMGLDKVTQKGAYIKETRGPRIVLWSSPTFRGKKSSMGLTQEPGKKGGRAIRRMRFRESHGDPGGSN